MLRRLRALRLLSGPAGPSAPHLERGREGERAAARMLRRAGFKLLARNLETPAGEADIVCLERSTGTLVLVEVKTRTHRAGERPVSPTVAIHAEKRRRLVRTLETLASLPRFRGRPARIDIVTVEETAGSGEPPTITHYPNAVTADGRLR